MQIDYCEVCNQRLNTWRAELVSLLCFLVSSSRKLMDHIFSHQQIMTRKTRDAPQLKCSPSLTAFRQYDTNSNILSLHYIKWKCNKVTHHSKGNYWTFDENKTKTSTHRPPPNTHNFVPSFLCSGRALEMSTLFQVTQVSSALAAS